MTDIKPEALDDLVGRITRPLYVFRMNRAQASDRDHPKARAANTALTNARRQIHDTVVEYVLDAAGLRPVFEDVEDDKVQAFVPGTGIITIGADRSDALSSLLDAVVGYAL